MTNHPPLPQETFVQRIGKKKKATKMVRWKDEYERRDKLRKLKQNGR